MLGVKCSLRLGILDVRATDVTDLQLGGICSPGKSVVSALVCVLRDTGLMLVQ